MRSSSALLGVSVLLGLGLFVAMFFVLPKPSTLRVPVALQRYLPQAEDRQVPLPAQAEEDIAPENKAILTFVGDIMLARDVERSIAMNGTDWPFAELGDLFAGSDLVIGNLEGTVRPTRKLEIVNQMSFDTTPDNVAMLKETGFTHLSIANNHADDYGSQVTVDTRDAVRAAGMTPFGDPYDSELFIVRENVGGVSLSLIGFHAFGEKSTEILHAIKTEDAQGRFVIIYPHWGPEYIETAPAVETDAAQLFINAGADLIVGAHPHVIQNVEVIGDVPVIYSLGNFLFDQDFSAETMRGLTARVTITDEAIELGFTPVHIKGRQTFPMEASDAQLIFDEFELGTGHLRVLRNE